jgi:nucleotide-binding universal stress UspA family protein
VGLRKIVVGVDGTEHSQRVLTWALTEGILRHAPCVALYACDVESRGEDSYVAPAEMERAVTAGKAILARILAEVPAELTEGVAVEEQVIFGPAGTALIAASEEALMLVVGSRGRSTMRDLLLGSVSTACAQHSRCPVVVVPPEWRGS